jgi:hypothetical protein
MSSFFDLVKQSRTEYEDQYLPYLRQRKERRAHTEQIRQKTELEKLQEDIKNASLGSAEPVE